LPAKYQIDLPDDAELIVSIVTDESSESKREVEAVQLASTVVENNDAQIDNDSIAKNETESSDLSMAAPNLDEGLDLKSYLVEMEVQLIQKALSQTDGNVSQAAKLLQTNRTTLVEKIRKYDLT
ncbi:MAG: helix-turn-helix domain-containing protein, partial [Pseudomonadota bacterium]|nr:helix-turn-helix domain-containing protein [Pseudomonadota bacterium]